MHNLISDMMDLGRTSYRRYIQTYQANLILRQTSLLMLIIEEDENTNFDN
jgi:hypothetical protein